VDVTESATRVPERAFRRTFLRYLIRALGLLWAGGLLLAMLSYLQLPSELRTMASQAVEVGPETGLLPGQARLVTGNHRPFWLIRTGRGELTALAAVCTHRHCVLVWEAESATLKCPCHGGRFDINGNVLDGPPSRPLASLTISIKGGMVYVYI
jgi:cytochrome b6-f complex iron-sulfur subunit